MNFSLNFHSWTFLLFLLIAPLACAQPTVDHPHVDDSAFDQKLERLLSFTVPLITVDQLQQTKETVYLFDTRKKEEYDISHINGAKYLGYRDFDASRLGDLPKDAPIVVYCSVGYRSEKIGEKLMQLGYTNVSNLYGSLFEWVNLDYPVVNNQGQTTEKVHAYNKNWSRWIRSGKIKKVW